MVLPFAMAASRLSISRRHGTDSRGWVRLLHGTCHVFWVHKLPKLNFSFRLNSTKVFFYLLNLIIRNNFENACSMIHFSTNQMQIQFN